MVDSYFARRFAGEWIGNATFFFRSLAGFQSLEYKGRAMRLTLFALPILLISAGCSGPTGPDDSSGSGRIVVHVTLTTGGLAPGASTYIVKESTEQRQTADQNGNATYSSVPAGSWDAGFFPDARYAFGPPGEARKTITVRNDQTVDVTLIAAPAAAPPGPR